MRKRIFAMAFQLMLAGSLAVVALAASGGDEVSEALDRGTEAFHRGSYERAMFEYRFALTWPGQHQARAHFNIGVCQHRLGRLREAATEYRAAVKGSGGKYPAASYALGIALQELREFHDARAAFTQAVEASGGKHAEALFELGLHAHAEHDTRAAVDFYNRAIKQSKDSIPASHNNLGVILASYGQMDDAQREFERALELSRGKFEEARDNLARCRQLLSSKSQTLIADLKTSVAPARIQIASE